MISISKEAARRLLHVQVLLKAEKASRWTGLDRGQISEALDVSTSVLVQVRRAADRAGATRYT